MPYIDEVYKKTVALKKNTYQAISCQIGEVVIDPQSSEILAMVALLMKNIEAQQTVIREFYDILKSIEE